MVKTRYLSIYVILILLSAHPLAAIAGDKQNLLLSNNALGPLKLSQDMRLDLAELKRLFPAYSVKSGIGEQDGPDYRYYEVSDSSDVVFHIKAQDDDPKKIDILYVQSPLVTDKYGLKIGMTYEDIKRLRPALTHKTDYHFHTYMMHPDENIRYEISGDFEGPDKTDFSENEIRDWTIERLLWVPR